MIRIVTCQYQLELLANWETYVQKIENLIAQAKTQGAQIVLLPEYAGVEIVTHACPDDASLFATIQPLLPQYLAFFQRLAAYYQLYIQAGTTMVATTSGRYVNRAYLFSPNGQTGYQDKLQLVPYEEESNLIQAGDQQCVFQTQLGMLAIAVCYDSEFPELIRPLVHAGAWLLLVPSYTISLAGCYRVLISSRARSLENQCYTAVAGIVGPVPHGENLDHTTGQASVFGPVDSGFPADGIIAQGKRNQVELVTAELDPEKLKQVRRHGQVRNLVDSEHCQRFTNQAVRMILL